MPLPVLVMLPTSVIGPVSVKTPVPELMVAAPVVGAAAWMLDGIFIGATRTADMRNMMVLSAAVYAIAAVVLVPAFGNHGLWAAMTVGLAMRGVTLGLRYPALERSAARGGGH